jgi:hypothetical protein
MGKRFSESWTEFSTHLLSASDVRFSHDSGRSFANYDCANAWAQFFANHSSLCSGHLAPKHTLAAVELLAANGTANSTSTTTSTEGALQEGEPTGHAF